MYITLHMYICMYIYEHTHTHTHARTRTRTRTRAHTHSMHRVALDDMLAMHEVRATAHMHVRALHTHLHAPVNHAPPLDLSFECCVPPPPPLKACNPKIQLPCRNFRLSSDRDDSEVVRDDSEVVRGGRECILKVTNRRAVFDLAANSGRGLAATNGETAV